MYTVIHKNTSTVTKVISMCFEEFRRERPQNSQRASESSHVIFTVALGLVHCSRAAPCHSEGKAV